MRWKKFRIFHSQKNKIDLYCRQQGENLEIYITNGDIEKLKVLVHDFLVGKLDDLLLDQYSNAIDWEMIDFDFGSFTLEFDMAEARKRNRNKDSLDFLKYHVANSINSTFSNRGFSRYLRKNIVGKWAEKKLALEFYDDETYILIRNRKPSTTFAGIPESGQYYFSGNTLLFWGNQNSGLRTQVIDLNNNKIILPGFSGKLFFILTKQKAL